MWKVKLFFYGVFALFIFSIGSKMQGGLKADLGQLTNVNYMMQNSRNFNADNPLGTAVSFMPNTFKAAVSGVDSAMDIFTQIVQAILIVVFVSVVVFGVLYISDRKRKAKEVREFRRRYGSYYR